MNVTHAIEKFIYPPESTLSQEYKEKLTKFKHKFQDYLQRPSKYGPTKTDIITDNLFNKEKERNWKLVNSKQQKNFLFDTHSNFETMIISQKNIKKSTLEPIKKTYRSVSTAKI